MPIGQCKKCGTVYYGWSLKYIPDQVCTCGGKIINMEDKEDEIGT